MTGYHHYFSTPRFGLAYFLFCFRVPLVVLLGQTVCLTTHNMIAYFKRHLKGLDTKAELLAPWLFCFGFVKVFSVS